MRMRILIVTAVVALFGCGLLEPSGPPARAVTALPGVPSGHDPLPQPSDVPSDPASPVVAPLPGYVLAWHDEFDGSALDEHSWSFDLGPWHDALNTKDAVEVSGGILSLITFTDSSGVHHAGHINTKGKYEGAFGYYEARVRFLDSVGQWCSFFLYPQTMGNPIGDPAVAGVEADVFEHREADQAGWDFSNTIQVGLNWDGFGAYWKYDHLVVAHPQGAPLKGEWHRYAVLWTETGYTFYVDELPVYRTGAAVSHIAEPIYLTCEVRDGSWDGYIPSGGYGPRDSSTTRMHVDWVRAWTPAP